MLGELRPDEVVEQGLEQALIRLVAAIRTRSGATITIDGTITGVAPVEQAMAVFRIVQEALNNAVKHARATVVSVTLVERPDGLCVTVADDGVGFDTTAVAARTHGGIGMRSMQERSASAGLAITIASVPGDGTTVQLLVPLCGR